MSNLENINEPDIPIEWQWERLRLHRNQLLNESDYKMISDTPFNKIKWAEYRQALRDLPTANIDPTKISFPIKPID